MAAGMSDTELENYLDPNISNPKYLYVEALSPLNTVKREDEKKMMVTLSLEGLT